MAQFHTLSLLCTLLSEQHLFDRKFEEKPQKAPTKDMVRL